MSVSSSGSSDCVSYPLHDAAELGDVEALRALLERKNKQPQEPQEPQGEGEEGGRNGESSDDDFGSLSVDLDERDGDGCTALHVALLHCRLDAANVILSAGASSTKRLEGSSMAHIAICRGASGGQHEFAAAALKVLLTHGIEANSKDDRGRTLVHVAASYGMGACLSLLLNDPAGLETIDAKERMGLRPLHLAVLGGHVDAAEQLLNAKADVEATNQLGWTSLHCAFSKGHWKCASVLLSKAGAKRSATNKQGLTARQLAEKKGLVIPASLLKGNGALAQQEKNEQPPLATLVYYHKLCMEHYSSPHPISRSGPEPPPENVNRLKVIYDEHSGVLRSSEFAALHFDDCPPRAAMADILRVHEFSYVEKLQQLCAKIPDSPRVLKNLDADTAVSHNSFEAAMHAAGSVCSAIDQLMAGKHRNAFCAVRPPGHHAGPRGLVTCSNDGEGSHGFCLLNNVAVGGAYARHMYRDRGIKKVAIIDFDVHHGNGTEEIVRNLVPHVEESTYVLPFCTGTAQALVYKPWLDEEDPKSCLFISVHGYGKKERGHDTSPGGWFYPGSGATRIPPSLPKKEPKAMDEGVKEEADAQGGEAGEPHDDDDDDAEKDLLILDVGVALPEDGETPGTSRHSWRNAYRNKVLPALIKFDPDLILISAGFDAHKKDMINFGYIGLLDEDYEWITDQLVQVANKCCDGRIVSVLEGGYRIQGGPVSAFGRSVAGHVRALQDGCTSRQVWDEEDAQWERRHEETALAERERRRQLKLAQQAQLLEEREKALTAAMAAEKADREEQPAAAVAAAGATPPSEDEPLPRKRRRGNVDYVALAKTLQQKE